jgi:hypothetical protein
MSDTILPFQEWPEGIAQASVPANENSLRNEALRRPCLGTENNVASPADGDLYIVGPSPTGSFSTFNTNDLAFARVTDDGTSWYAWAPTDGLRVWLEDGTQIVFVSGSTNDWVNAGTGSVSWGDISGTLSSQTDLQSVLDSKAQDRRTVTAAASTSGVLAIDCSLGDYFTHALDENITSWSFSNLPGSGNGATLMLRFTQDSTPRTVAWPASFKWAGGTVPSVSTASGAIDILAITTFDNGTTWDATLAKAFA